MAQKMLEKCVTYCAKCQTRFPNKTFMNEHECDFIFTCLVCKKVFPNKKRTIQHGFNEHRSAFRDKPVTFFDSAEFIDSCRSARPKSSKPQVSPARKSPKHKSRSATPEVQEIFPTPKQWGQNLTLEQKLQHLAHLSLDNEKQNSGFENQLDQMKRELLEVSSKTKKIHGIEKTVGIQTQMIEGLSSRVRQMNDTLNVFMTVQSQPVVDENQEATNQIGDGEEFSDDGDESDSDGGGVKAQVTSLEDIGAKLEILTITLPETHIRLILTANF